MISNNPSMLGIISKEAIRQMNLEKKDTFAGTSTFINEKCDMMTKESNAPIDYASVPPIK